MQKLIKATRKKRSGKDLVPLAILKSFIDLPSKLEIQRSIVFHLILVGILSIIKVACQQSISKKRGESFLSILPKPQ